MSYQYKADDLNQFQKDIKKEVGALEPIIGNVMGKAQKAFEDERWEGKAAIKYKNYHNTVYKTINDELLQLCKQIKECMDIYYSSYIYGVDTDNHAVIFKDEIDQFIQMLPPRKREVNTIDGAVRQEISDIRYITGSINYSYPAVVDSIDNILQTVEQLYGRIEGTEGNIISSFTTIEEGFTRLNHLLDLCLKTTVSSDGRTLHYDEAAILAAVNDTQLVYADQQNWEAANEMIIDQSKELVERDGRARDAETVKMVVGIACAIGAVVATVATGGAFAAVVIAGAASGAIVAGVNSGADQ